MARCLVVDDSLVVQEAVCDALGDLGHDVVRVGRGEDALETLASEAAFDLVFLDIHLPGLSGLEVLRNLRTRYPRVKVVVMTSDRDRGTFNEVEGVDDRVDGFLHKPFDKDVLNICLDVVLKKGGRFRHKKQDAFD